MIEPIQIDDDYSTEYKDGWDNLVRYLLSSYLLPSSHDDIQPDVVVEKSDADSVLEAAIRGEKGETK